MPREVKCADCHTLVEDDHLEPKERRKPCAECGGLDRLITVGDSLDARWSVRATVSDSLDARWRVEANKSAESHAGVAHVTGTGAVNVSGSKTEPASTFLELPLPVNAKYELRIAEEESILYIEVSKDETVLGCGQGDDIVEALLSMLPYMLPRDHPEYPKLPDR
jgi:NAD-dependent SIR2 family protein deacetylase